MNVASPLLQSEESDPPEGWTEICVGDLVSRIEAGKNLRCIEQPPAKDKKGIVKISAVTWGEFLEDESKTLHKNEDFNKNWQIKPGDFLISRANTIELVGACVIARSVSRTLMLSDKVLRLHLADDWKEWLLLFLRSSLGRFQIESLATGNQLSMRNISQENLRRIVVPLPPLAEQKRIVQKVEHLLAHVDVTRDRLARVPAIMKRFRQAVLAAACSGRLTADCREQRRVGPDCFEEIENRLKTQKDKGKPAEWHEPDFELKEQTELPEGWQHIALGNLGDWATGGTPATGKASYWDDGTIPWLSPKDMKAEVIGDTRDHITEYAVEETGLRIIPKDAVLFVVRGLILAHSFPVAILSRSLTINQDIRAIIPNEAVFPEYLLRAMQSESLAILYAVRESTHGTRRLESPTLKRWPIPLPPMEEQKEIVRRVDNLFKLARAIEKSVIAGTARAEKLTQAILAKALRGELVPTEAELARREGRSYESAAELSALIGTGNNDTRASVRKNVTRGAGRKYR